MGNTCDPSIIHETRDTKKNPDTASRSRPAVKDSQSGPFIPHPHPIQSHSSPDSSKKKTRTRCQRGRADRTIDGLGLLHLLFSKYTERYRSPHLLPRLAGVCRVLRRGNSGGIGDGIEGERRILRGGMAPGSGTSEEEDEELRHRDSRAMDTTNFLLMTALPLGGKENKILHDRS